MEPTQSSGTRTWSSVGASHSPRMRRGELCEIMRRKASPRYSPQVGWWTNGEAVDQQSFIDLGTDTGKSQDGVDEFDDQDGAGGSARG